MVEFSYDISVARVLRSVEAASYAPSKACGLVHWCEWQHDLESVGSFESTIKELQSQNWPLFLKPGSVSLDIGAYSGDTAIPLGLFSYGGSDGERAVVIAVEPNPYLQPLLKLNLALNSYLADFRVVEAAITSYTVDSVEISDFGTQNCNTGIVSDSLHKDLRDRLRSSTTNTYCAPGLSLDDLVAGTLRQSELSRLSFIKIDCEGYDKEILKAGSSFLSAHKPVLYVEWFKWFDNSDSADLFDVIADIKYDAYDPVTLEAACLDHWLSDLILLPRGKTPADYSNVG